MEDFTDLFITSCVILIFLFLILWTIDFIASLFFKIYYAARTGVSAQRPLQVVDTDPQQWQLVPWRNYDNFGGATKPTRQFQNRRRLTLNGRPAQLQELSYTFTPIALRAPEQMKVKPTSQNCERYYTPFLTACWDCDDNKIALHILNGADILEKTQQGETGLVLATYRMAKGKKPWNPTCLRLLINNGCSVNEPTNDKNTALHIAVKAGHIVIVKWLLSNGASVRAQNKSGWRAMSIAKAQGRTDIVAILWQNYFLTEEAESNQEGSSESEYHSAKV